MYFDYAGKVSGGNQSTSATRKARAEWGRRRDACSEEGRTIFMLLGMAFCLRHLRAARRGTAAAYPGQTGAVHRLDGERATPGPTTPATCRWTAARASCIWSRTTAPTSVTCAPPTGYHGFGRRLRCMDLQPAERKAVDPYIEASGSGSSSPGRSWWAPPGPWRWPSPPTGGRPGPPGGPQPRLQQLRGLPGLRRRQGARGLRLRLRRVRAAATRSTTAAPAALVPEAIFLPLGPLDGAAASYPCIGATSASTSETSSTSTGDSRPAPHLRVVDRRRGDQLGRARS